MTMPVVHLRDVVDEIDVLSDDAYAYLNKRTGELVTIRGEHIRVVENGYDLEGYHEWEQELVRKTEEVIFSKDYLALPSQFDIHEYEIIKHFCYAIEDVNLREEFLYRIRGSGAFRRFKDTIHRRGVADDWYRYRQNALERIAIGWLEANGIAYTREDEHP